MRKFLTVTAVALALGTIFPQASVLPAAHAQAAAPSMVSPNRFGLPDFGDLVEQVGPAVVNIRVVQRAAQGTAGENPLANDPFYDFLRRFGVPMPGFPGQPGMGPRARQGIGSGFMSFWAMNTSRPICGGNSTSPILPSDTPAMTRSCGRTIAIDSPSSIPSDI